MGRVGQKEARDAATRGDHTPQDETVHTPPNGSHDWTVSLAASARQAAAEMRARSHPLGLRMFARLRLKMELSAQDTNPQAEPV